MSFTTFGPDVLMDASAGGLGGPAKQRGARSASLLLREEIPKFSAGGCPAVGRLDGAVPRSDTSGG